jgi:hypothetical protein
MPNPDGSKRDPKYPQRRPGPATVSAAEVRAQTQRGLDAAAERETTPRAPQRVSNPQNYKKG